MGEYVPLSSTVIAAIAYDDTTWALNVRLHSGAEYQYLSVPPDVYEGFLSAGSVGRYYDAAIKKAGYQYVRIS
ncbi:MAG TPA: KTSC domain-containing protein [Bryobacteraceae bacterium]|nr:KTSC domain-containing protein [Bryobacteraceae bacterium]